MLTGRPAFIRATTAETMAAVLKEDPLETFGARLAALTRIVSRCLEKSRETRFQSARDLGFAMEVLSATAETAVPALDAASHDAPPSRARRRRGLVAIAVIAALTSWLRRDDAPSSVDEVSRTRRLRRSRIRRQRRGRRDFARRRFIVFMADRDGPFHVWRGQIESRDVRRSHAGPRRPAESRAHPQRRIFSRRVSIWLAGTAGNRLRLMPFLGGTPNPFLAEHAVNVTWSHDGSKLVYFTYDRGDPLTVADRTRRQPTSDLVEHERATTIIFPRGRRTIGWIYFARGSQASTEYDIWRIASEGGTPERLTHHNNYVRYLTPIDARTMLYVAPDEDGSGSWLWALDVERKDDAAGECRARAVPVRVRQRRSPPVGRQRRQSHRELMDGAHSRPRRRGARGQAV